MGQPVFKAVFDIGAPELLVLIIAAVVVFGPDKLPEFFRKAARVVRYVRGIANNAQTQLRQELGSDFDDFDFRDLNPRQFVQKHLFDEVEPIVADVKSELTSAAADGTAAASAAREAWVDRTAGDGRKPQSPGGPEPVLAVVRITPYDPDAT